MTVTVLLVVETYECQVADVEKCERVMFEDQTYDYYKKILLLVEEKKVENLLSQSRCTEVNHG